MKAYGKKIVIGGLVLVVAQLVHAYKREHVALGQQPSFDPEYYVQVIENGTWQQYAVDLTPQEKSAVQRAVKNHFDSDRSFNKRVSQDDIELILSGCKKGDQHVCEVIRRVLNDFVGKSFGQMFTAIGLSRDI